MRLRLSSIILNFCQTDKLYSILAVFIMKIQEFSKKFCYLVMLVSCKIIKVLLILYFSVENFSINLSNCSLKL